MGFVFASWDDMRRCLVFFAIFGNTSDFQSGQLLDGCLWRIHPSGEVNMMVMGWIAMNTNCGCQVFDRCEGVPLICWGCRRSLKVFITTDSELSRIWDSLSQPRIAKRMRSVSMVFYWACSTWGAPQNWKTNSWMVFNRQSHSSGWLGDTLILGQPHVYLPLSEQATVVTVVSQIGFRRFPNIGWFILPNIQ